MMHPDECFGPCCLYCVCSLCACIYHTEFRESVRKRFNIKDDGCDCCTATFCGSCAMIQEGHELKVGMGGPVRSEMS